MATIRPFRGVRYRFGDLSSVVSQPYDRVRYGLQDKYYDLNPYNVVRIVKGKALSSDLPNRPEGPNVYTRARSYLDLWGAEEVLVQEEKLALYVCHQTFEVHGQTMTRKSLIAALALTRFEEGLVLPHERTHAGPKVDRLRLLWATRVNLGQIFMLYPDPTNRVTTILDEAIANKAPDAEAVEMFESDVRQQLWVVTDERAMQAVQEDMASKRNLIIADGHHRYETALNYRDEMRKAHPDAPQNAAFAYRMASLVSMDDPGLVILPTHREVLNWPRVPVGDLLSRAASLFRTIPADGIDRCLATMKAEEHNHAFGLYAEGQYHVLVLRGADLVETWVQEDHTTEWKSLDVSIAHQTLLRQVVGLSEEAMEGEDHLRYHRDPLLAIKNVDSGEGSLSVFLNPTRIDQVKTCAEQGEKMPQKSTDFYPKMITGLTMMPVSAQEHM